MLLITSHFNDRGNPLLPYGPVNLYVVMHHNRSALFLPLTHKVDVKPIPGSKKQHLLYGVFSVIRDNDQ